MIFEITHKEKVIPLKIGYSALKFMEAETGTTIIDMQKGKINFTALESLFYGSMRAGAKELGQKFDLPRDEGEWIWEDHQSAFDKMLPEAFAALQNQEAGKKKDKQNTTPSVRSMSWPINSAV